MARPKKSGERIHLRPSNEMLQELEFAVRVLGITKTAAIERAVIDYYQDERNWILCEECKSRIASAYDALPEGTIIVCWKCEKKNVVLDED